MRKETREYHEGKEPDRRLICDRLYEIIEADYGENECKLWHGAPVWFIDGNPIVGYHGLKAGVRLMFWSGQSFSEPGLENTGTFKAACKIYRTLSDIDANEIRSWLANGRDMQWDYKNIIKNKGLLPLTGVE